MKNMMTIEQMELGLHGQRECKSVARRQNRASRGRWWFEQMRRVVDRATDWERMPPARPEQTYLGQGRGGR
jgi:hypothetical protein